MKQRENGSLNDRLTVDRCWATGGVQYRYAVQMPTAAQYNYAVLDEALHERMTQCSINILRHTCKDRA